MIVIPMAGLSRRFTENGYTVPKYMLEAHGKSLFFHAVNSFSKYFMDTKFLFIAREVSNTEEFILSEIKKLGILDAEVVMLDSPTLGQAETVSIGLERSKANLDDSLLIFNIDTIRMGYLYPITFDMNGIDGYLEVFRGSGKNWSYILPDLNNPNRVIETAEKKEISEYCCSGIYFFKSVEIFQKAYRNFYIDNKNLDNGNERYIAPMYNFLIKNNYKIYYEVVDKEEIIFSGVPEEYKDFLKSTI